VKYIAEHQQQYINQSKKATMKKHAQSVLVAVVDCDNRQLTTLL